MKKILVICGPTATGKTELAIKLAEKFNGELISADSRQVYQGMDIITGKDHPPGTNIHLVDVVKPDEEFSVAQYTQLAWQVIKKTWKAGRLPIIVGGTGFYIKAVVDGVDTIGIPPNEKVRQGMNNWSVKELMDYLANLDPVKAAALNKSDRNNPRRLIRAIEIAMATQNSCLPAGRAKLKTQNYNAKVKIEDTLYIGLKTDYKTLYRRIDQRVTKRIRMGAEKEVEGLFQKGYSWENSALGVTTGYWEWRDYFDKKASKDAIVEKWRFAEHAYARRQMTWFRKALSPPTGGSKGKWFDIGSRNWQNEVEELVKVWYDAKN